MSIASTRSKSVINWEEEDPMADFQPKPQVKTNVTGSSVPKTTASMPSTAAKPAQPAQPAKPARDDVQVFSQPPVTVANKNTASSSKTSTPVTVPTLNIKQLTLEDHKDVLGASTPTDPNEPVSFGAELREEKRKSDLIAWQQRFVPIYNQLKEKCMVAASRRLTYLRLPTPVEKEVVEMFLKSGVQYYEKIENGVKVYYLDWDR